MRLQLPSLVIASILVHLGIAHPVATSTATLDASPPSKITPAPSATSEDACYTYTTSLHAQTCEPLACVELMCLTYSTTKLPCPTASCPSTPTVTEWLPCRTACRGGCATATVPVVADACTKER